MNRLLLLSCLCLILPSASAGSWETGAFRTASGQLIQRGMTKAEVLRDAGTPLDGKSGKASTSKSSPKGDVWKYRGSDGIYTLSFGAGRVVKIEVAPSRGP